MPQSLYICLQNEDNVATFSLDADTGQLTRQAEMAVAAGRRCWRSALTGETAHTTPMLPPSIASAETGCGVPKQRR